MHLLLVEDNAADVYLVREAIKEIASLPLELSIVQNGQDALLFLRRWEQYAHVSPPDLILLDLNLPAKDGHQVLTEIRQDPTLHAVPVVVITSDDRQTSIDNCYAQGANAYMLKPIGLEEFIVMVKTTIAFWSGCRFPTRPSVRAPSR